MNMDKRSLYWKKDDKKYNKTEISREIVCNFDGQGFYHVIIAYQIMLTALAPISGLEFSMSLAWQNSMCGRRQRGQHYFICYYYFENKSDTV